MITDKWHKRCCWNCRHHLDYHMEGRYAETVVCAIRSRKDMGNYIGVDYDQRIAADHTPCDLWEVDTNVPAGFKWHFLDNQPKQLTIDFDY